MQTMTEPWTPGPWAVEGIWEDGYGSRDREREPADLWTVKPVMTPGGYDGLWHGGVEREADARLIKEAPEMAELVADLADHLGPCDDPAENPHVEVWCITHREKRCTAGADRDKARALLSRIRGA